MDQNELKWNEIDQNRAGFKTIQNGKEIQNQTKRKKYEK